MFHIPTLEVTDMFKYVFSGIAMFSAAITAIIGAYKFGISWNKTRIEIAKEKSVGAQAIAKLWDHHNKIQQDFDDLKHNQEALKDDNKEMKNSIEKLAQDYKELIKDSLEWFRGNNRGRGR